MSQEATKVIKIQSNRILTPLTETEMKTLFSNHTQVKKMKKDNNKVGAVETKRNCTVQNNVQQASLFQKNYNKSVKNSTLQPCKVNPGTSLLRKTFSLTEVPSFEPASAANPQGFVPLSNITNDAIRSKLKRPIKPSELVDGTSLPKYTFNFTRSSASGSTPLVHSTDNMKQLSRSNNSSTKFQSTFLKRYSGNDGEDDADALKETELGIGNETYHCINSNKDQLKNNHSIPDEDYVLENVEEDTLTSTAIAETENEYEEIHETQISNEWPQEDLPEEVRNQVPVKNQCTASSKENIGDTRLIQLLQAQSDLHDDEKCCSACRNVSLVIVAKLDEIIEISKQRSYSKTSKRSESLQFNLLDILPINDQETLKNFDEDLNNKCDLKKQLENKIDCIGGENMHKMVSNALSIIVTDSLANELTWKISKTNKLKIENFTFPKIVKDRVIKQFKTTETEILKRIQLWIQKSSDRIRNAKLAKEKEENN